MTAKNLNMFVKTFEKAAIGIAHVDAQGRWIHANKKLCEFLGYTHEELLERTFKELTFAEDIELDLFHANELYQGIRDSFSIEKRYIRKDGTSTWANLTATAVRNEVGDIEYFIAVVEDINSRIQTKMALKEEKDRAKLYLDVANVILLSLDENAIIQMINPKGCSILGYTEEELLGKNCFETILPQRSHTNIHAIKQKLMNGEIELAEYYENSVITKSGEERLIAWHNGVIRNDEGKIIGIMTSGEDITDKRASESSYKELFNAVKQAIYIQDLDGRFLDVNDGALEIYGYQKEDFIGKTPKFLSAPGLNNLEEIGVCIAKAINGSPQRFEFWGKKKNGDIFLKDMSLVTSNYFGKKVLIATAIDITERKNAEIETQRLLNDLKKSESTLLHLLKMSPMGVRIAKKDGQEIVFANDSYRNTTQINISTSIDKNLRKYYVHPNEYDEIVQQINNNEIIHNKLIELFINNQTIWALASFTPMEFEGEPCVLGWFYDITEQKKLEQQLSDDKNFISSIIDNANSIIAVIDSNGVMFKLNQYGLNFTSYSQEEIASEPYFWKCLLSETLQDKVIEIINNAKKGIITKSFQNEWISKNGEIRIFEWSNTLVLKPDGSMNYLVTIGVDVTEQEFQKMELHRQKEEFEAIFNTSKDGIAVLDMESNFLDFNEAYLNMTGFEREELLATSCIALSAPEDRERAIEAMNTVVKVGYIIGFEKTCIVKDGKRLTINITATLLPDKKRVLITTKDITEMKEHEHQLEYIAHYDALTGLPNRVLKSDRLRQAMIHAERRNEKIAVVYLDLDGFKQVNDRYGHSIGDQLLIALSTRMKQALREGDTLSRLGGDEFVAILVDMDDTSSAFPIIKRLLDAASQAIEFDDIVVQVSASIGVTFYPQDEDVDADQLIRQADQAMYAAKQSGKNRYHVFDSEHDRTIRIRHEHLERIQQALYNNEFVLYYQPKVNMRTGELIGAEALIRWQHPTEGLIPPLEFLPIIENHPLSIKVGEWVINKAISQIKQWQAEGLNLLVSVNVGAKQLLQGNFVERLRLILAKHKNFNSSSLKIEVLETSALEDVDLASSIIEECKTMGIYFALDDFGTGYSSLTYLKRLPVVTLKIDQSFVRDMLEDRDDLAILEGITGLAKAFDREVIAEGVETHEHGQQLLLLGCDLAQGYGIAQPMPAEKLIEWSQKWEKDHEWLV
ncbi:MAG: PAS domain S-box protein [Sulfuricurvum sp.]|nr:PAS domain S-box protein [Sulfuricurvum sp.]MDD5387476.1 PAS domain S-box protein [Sulfuricurvum sp.]